MRLSSSSVSRTTPPAERSGQRAERAPGGDFAALLDLAPARAPLPRPAEREERPSGAGRPDHRSTATPARSDQARPAAARSAGMPRGRAPGSADLRAARAGDHPAGPSTAGEMVPGVPAPNEAPTSAHPGPVAADVLASSIAGQSPPLAAECPAAVRAAAPPAIAVGGSAGEPSPAPPASVPPPPPAGPAPGPFAPGVAAAPDLAGAAGTPVLEPALVAPQPAEDPSPAVSSEAVAAAGAAGAGELPFAGNFHRTPATEAAATDASRAEAADAATDPAAGTQPAVAPTPDAAGSGAGSTGARDGEEARGARPEGPDAPAGASASVAAPSPGAVPGAGRAPEAVPFASPRSVELERAPRAVAQLLHVASQAGVSHARIALRPVELGGIEILLQASPAGLAAQVIADSPEAARMLSQATEDLRRSLADRNVELVSIDVSTSAEQQQRRDDLAAGGFLADDLRTGGRPMSRRADTGAVEAPAPTDRPTVLELPDGLLVDVLA